MADELVPHSLEVTEHTVPMVSDGPGWQKRQIENDPFARRVMETDREVSARNAPVVQSSAPTTQPDFPALRARLADAIAAARTSQDALDEAETAVRHGENYLRDHDARLVALDRATAIVDREAAERLLAGAQAPVADPRLGERARCARVRDALADAVAVRVAARAECRQVADYARRRLHGAAKAVIAAEMRLRADRVQVIERVAAEARHELEVLNFQIFNDGMPGAGTPLKVDAEVAAVLIDSSRGLGLLDVAPPVAARRDRAIAARWQRFFSRLLIDADTELEEDETAVQAAE